MKASSLSPRSDHSVTDFLVLSWYQSSAAYPHEQARRLI
jgi:hypothetical protein